jgi:radical SAM/Cys-rich protein
MNHFEEKISPIMGDGLYSQDIATLQVNVGLRCNQECGHCHVSASPLRSEVMEWPTMELILETVERVQPEVVDLTGGAPELNPNIRRFVEGLYQQGRRVHLRTNLTALMEPGIEEMPEFFRERRVQLTASLPCYLKENVQAQRGEGIYEKSVKVLRQLNSLGYGSQPDLGLNLVYNPGGAFLPSEQGRLEADYRRELDERFGIVFTRLLTITNMPIGRFWTRLRRIREDQKYLSLLKRAFNSETLDGLMCRHQISVGWDGTFYDCDFNLALGLPVNHGAPTHIASFEQYALEKRRIVTGEHCFGCTAGCGSSCKGALV